MGQLRPLRSIHHTASQQLGTIGFYQLSQDPFNSATHLPSTSPNNLSCLHPKGVQEGMLCCHTPFCTISVQRLFTERPLAPKLQELTKYNIKFQAISATTKEMHSSEHGSLQVGPNIQYHHRTHGKETSAGNHQNSWIKLVRAIHYG